MKRKAVLSLAAIILLLANLAALVQAQSGGASTTLSAWVDLTWSTVDGGGGVSGTAGQPDAGALTGGSYTLAGGFWSGAAASYQVYLPVVIK